MSWKWSLLIGTGLEKSKMRPFVKNLGISLKVCVIKLLNYCATPKDCMFYFSLFTFCCKTALSISYKNDVCMRAYVWSMDQLVALWELLSPRKWGEQLCWSVYFGMNIEMDGSESDCRLARCAKQTVDHQPAESHTLTRAIWLNHSVWIAWICLWTHLHIVLMHLCVWNGSYFIIMIVFFKHLPI